MREVVLYLKCNKDVETQAQDVFLKDIASIECEDTAISARVKAIRVHHFKENSTRTVVSVIKIIQLICKECPQVLVQSIGETDVLIEKVQVDTYKGWKQWLKVVLVCLVSFFGTAFTIMAYNNDVGVGEVFEKIYVVVMNKEPQGLNVLEITYSIGLAAGIIVFFNHIGGRRITKDPTPIEVSMKNYERDVNQALIETADREGLEEDA
ncbi:MAG: stage V sporulation protein AA [Lachnospiraceae bacterium]|nr:stage V sporulation protein AA [Lachnospiraceae bacterium]